MILEQNTQYQAIITLSGEELLASNSKIESVLKEHGFVNVKVEGKIFTKERTATGTWGKATQEAEVPKQVSSIKKL